MKINSRGFWENSTSEGHGHDEGLAKALIEFFEKDGTDILLDVGCGDGYYTNLFNDNGISCLGIDGNPHTQEIAGKENTEIVDVSKSFDTIVCDWVLSLEVGEHIPSEYEDIFISNLDRHNKNGIILSWAVRGQGGDGHINCKNNDEVIEKICNLGYTFKFKETQDLRNKCAKYPDTGWWFRNTLMVFRKNV